MNSKYQEIDIFLKFFRDIIIANPKANLDELLGYQSIYSQLIRLGVSANDRKANLSQRGSFNYWINYFNANNNINVFVDPNWNYFCQFISKGKNRDLTELKVYVPIDLAHIDRSAIMLFQFLSDNHIAHSSKIGKHIRFDDIVIRLINPDDVIKIKDFINSNKYIKEGLLKPNPFAFSENGIAFACDGQISYNSTVAKYISLYLKDCLYNKKLNQVGVSSFYSFVSNYYHKTFITKANLQNIFTDFQFSKSNEFPKIVDYRCVTELILNNSNNPKFSYNDYLAHYYNYANPGYRERIFQEYSGFLNNAFPKQNDRVNNNLNKSVQQTSISDNELLETQKLLLRAYYVMSKKYDIPYALENLNGYLKEARQNFLTRDSNIRLDIVRSNFRNNMLIILSKNNISLEDYINILIQKDLLAKRSYLLNALLETEQRYGSIFIIDALRKLLVRSNYNGFTRQNNARINLMYNVTPDEIKNIIKKELNLGNIDFSLMGEKELNFIITQFINKTLNNQKLTTSAHKHL